MNKWSKKSDKAAVQASTLAELLVVMVVTSILLLAVTDGLTLFGRYARTVTQRIVRQGETWQAIAAWHRRSPRRTAYRPWLRPGRCFYRKRYDRSVASGQRFVVFGRQNGRYALAPGRRPRPGGIAGRERFSDRLAGRGRG